MIKWGPRAVAVAAVLFAFAYFIVRAHYYSSWMDDDAFISYRYARNLARGAGLVYNVGERVEGYSNFLWTLLLAGAHRLGAPLPEIARALGVAFAVATGVLLLAFPVLPPGNPGAKALLVILPTVALFLTDSWAAWAVGGLENPLGAFLVASTFLLYFRSLSARNPLPAAATAGVLATLAALTHPSYAVFGLLLGAHSIANAVRSRAWHRPIALAVPALIVGAPYIAWKIGYYGHVLPNTFRDKVGPPTEVGGGAGSERGPECAGVHARRGPFARVGAGGRQPRAPTRAGDRRGSTRGRAEVLPGRRARTQATPGARRARGLLGCGSDCLLLRATVSRHAGPHERAYRFPVHEHHGRGRSRARERGWPLRFLSATPRHNPQRRSRLDLHTGAARGS